MQVLLKVQGMYSQYKVSSFPGMYFVTQGFIWIQSSGSLQYETASQSLETICQMVEERKVHIK